MRIYIVGFPGSGKTTLLKHLAKRLHYQGLDMDQLLEQKFSMSVRDYFAQYGQASFREQEHLLLQETLQWDNAVIATGGGTPCFYRNMQWMNTHGITLYLEMNAKALFSRLQNAKDRRPLLSQETDLLQYIEQTLAERAPYYESAIIKVNGLNVNADEVVKQLKQYLP
ncbi:MAG: shikimate kinase [Bacteroidales bacterium]|nr:shikimate kinase [Bacteroidales bacterium]